MLFRSIGFSGTALGIPLGYAFLWLIQTFWTFDPSVYYISTIPVHVMAEDVLLVAGSAVVRSAERRSSCGLVRGARALLGVSRVPDRGKDRQNRQSGKL